MRTHYDNLKVAENAPDEVIRAAYKALSLRHHPDRNEGSDEARRVMQIINDAYEILGDPTRRAEYDAFLRRARAAERPSEPVIVSRHHPNTSPFDSPSEPAPKPVSKEQPRRSLVGTFFRLLFWDLRLTLVVIFFGWLAIEEWQKDRKRNASRSASAPVQWSPPSTDKLVRPLVPAYQRPATAPNGSPWPVYPSYIPGTNIWASGGLSSVTVDNSGCDSDVHVKLKIWRDGQSHDVRECFIPARSRFTFEQVAPGWFDVRYRDLDSGQLAKTEAFELVETRTVSGTNYSDMRLTLYKVANGNMRTTGIAESEF